MSLTVALNAALSGLFANQQAIAATSDNIANVNTPDFARRQARFATDAVPGQFSGVDVAIVRAAADRFLQAAVYGGAADDGAASAIADALLAIERSLGAPGENISFANRLDEAFAALARLSSTPSSTAAKADALRALDAAFAAFARTQTAISAESSAALGRLDQGVARANALLAEIYRLNQAAPSSPGAADLLDRRLSELSTLVSINVVRSDDGRVAVSTGGGTLLADSAGYAALGIAAGPPAALTLSSVDPDTGALALVSSDISASVRSGELRGLFDLVNVELPRLAALVESTARGVAERLNAVYAGNVAVGATAPDGRTLIVESAGVFSVNAALLADPAQFAVARPTGGASGGANDGTGAALLADVAATPEARAAAETIAEIGSTGRAARETAETNGALLAELSARASAAAGVNLDEELANLVLYQRAYGANARVISAIDELWRTLLDIA